MLRILRPIPAESIRLLVFDLDGTLIDSAQDLCNSVNAMRAHCGYERLPDPVIANFIGDGAMMLVRRALAGSKDPRDAGTHLDEAFVGRAYVYFLDYYREHKLDFTYAYPGVAEALAALRRTSDGARRVMAVLTNKPVRPARAICEALGLAQHFFAIYGGDSFSIKKPDPMGLKRLMEEAGARPEETVMIGDSEVDMMTARNAGAWSVGCTFGLAPHTLIAVEPDIFADAPEDWTSALNPA